MAKGKMKEPTREDLDYVHKLILEVEKKGLVKDEILDECIELLNHFSVFHILCGICPHSSEKSNCYKIEWFWKLKDKLERLLHKN